MAIWECYIRATSTTKHIGKRNTGTNNQERQLMYLYDEGRIQSSLIRERGSLASIVEGMRGRQQGEVAE